MSDLSEFAKKILGASNRAIEPIMDVLGFGSPPPPPPDLNIPDPQAPNPQVDKIGSELYQQLLGLMDMQANTDLTNQQIGSLSDILNQQSTLAGKNLAGAGFAAGAATPANIAPIEQAKSSAFAKGIVGIQTAEQQRVDQNRNTALSLISNLRSSLAAEDQAVFDNKMNAAMFEWQQYVDLRGLELQEDEKEQAFWEFIIPIVIAAI